MSDIALNQVPGIAEAARQAADGHVVYFTDNGIRRVALVPVEFAAILEDLTPGQAQQVVDELADAVSVQAARAAIRDGEPVIPWEQAKTEAGL